MFSLAWGHFREWDVSAGDVDAVERKEGRGGMPCSCQKALEAFLRKRRHLPFNEIEGVVESLLCWLFSL